MVKLVIWDAIAPIMTSLYWQWIIVRVTNWDITSPWSTVTSMPVSPRTLTHWPLGDFDKDLVVFKFILAIDGCDISHEISSRWMSLDITDDKSKLVQVMAWCRQATTITWANVDSDLSLISHERHGVSNHQKLDCLFNSLFRITTKESSKLCITGSL